METNDVPIGTAKDIWRIRYGYKWVPWSANDASLVLLVQTLRPHLDRHFPAPSAACYYRLPKE